jgi:hypothetical protein
MVEYCRDCGRVRIVTFCPRCENIFVVYKGKEEILCNKCKLSVKLCMCKTKLAGSYGLVPH